MLFHKKKGVHEREKYLTFANASVIMYIETFSRTALSMVSMPKCIN